MEETLSRLNQAFETVSQREEDSFEFEFDEAIGKITGYVVRSDFRGVTVPVRQKWVWDFIRQELGEDSQKVGLVLAFSPDEFEDWLDAAS